MIVALAGGVGGAKLAYGLYRVLPPQTLTVVVNTADDCELFGLRISPDSDTVMYTLAGIANPQTGWGIAGDTFTTLAMLRRYGLDTWFLLGDCDFATHIRRTELLHSGLPLSAVTAMLAKALGVQATLLPMCDEPVATLVDTPTGQMEFQEYFVRHHHADPVQGVTFANIAEARVPATTAAALAGAEAIIFCPSNPIVSIGPILAVPGMRDLLRQARAPRVAVSPIVAGRALRGPADQMLAGLGYDVSPLGVALLYRDLLQGLVIDIADASQESRIADLGLRVLVTQTIMETEADRQRLAEEVLTFSRQLRVESS
jgi:LPPG:FO 2-phospho-L-lactate transferase